MIWARCKRARRNSAGGDDLRFLPLSACVSVSQASGTRLQDLAISCALDPALRSEGCGFFQGLLVFQLQRVDPDDGHLQAGLVGAVCGFHSLGLPLEEGWPAEQTHTTALTAGLRPVMMELVRAWLPVIGGALVLHGAHARRKTPGASHEVTPLKQRR